MEKKNVRLPLVNVDEIKIPFVKGSFVSKGKLIKGLFMIDSGATRNILNFRAAKYIEDDSILDTEMYIGAISNIGEMCKQARICITVGDVSEPTEFCISNEIDFQKLLGGGIIGILGVDFLFKHHLVIDFENRCLRHAEEDLDFDCMSFVFPMNFGLQQYGQPVAGVIKDDKEFVFLVDTGSNYTVMTQHALDNAASELEVLEEKSAISGIFGTEEADIANAKFSILTLGDEEGVTEAIEVEDKVLVLPNRKYITEYEDDTPPLSGMIGTGFMLRNRWVLDFKHGVLYSNQTK